MHTGQYRLPARNYRLLVYLHKISAPTAMADSAAAPPKPSSSVKLVLLGEAAVGKV